jgi:hypothetical protein
MWLVGLLSEGAWHTIHSKGLAVVSTTFEGTAGANTKEIAKLAVFAT